MSVNETLGRLLCRVVVWAAVGVAHYFTTPWALNKVYGTLDKPGTDWLQKPVSYGLCFPLLGLEAAGGRPAGIGQSGIEQADSEALNTLVWIVTAAAGFEGARWLWAIRPGRRKPISREEIPSHG